MGKNFMHLNTFEATNNNTLETQAIHQMKLLE